MDVVENYLRHAEECKALARGNVTREEREMIESLADTWRTLAERRKQMLAMRDQAKTQEAMKSKRSESL